MRDAVAEVLLERRALVPRRIPLVVASLGLHALLAAVLILGAQRPSSLPARGSVLNIRLAPPPTVAAAPTVTMPKPPPEPEKQKTEKPKTTKPPKKPVEKALFGRSTEKPVPSRESPVPSPPAIRPATRDSRPGTAGLTALEGAEFPYTIYIDRMLMLIGNQWFRPQTAPAVTTQIYFVIERDGRVRDIKVEKESGSSVFDRAALRAVIEASPLPPLPYAYSGTYLGVHLTFH